MAQKRISKLDPKKQYLQIALNGSLWDARAIIAQLPQSDRIILEAGTPLIKKYGAKGIRRIHDWYQQRLMGQPLEAPEGKSTQGTQVTFSEFWTLITKKGAERGRIIEKYKATAPHKLGAFGNADPYIVADMKMMDRGATEVGIAAEAGASAVVALGAAPIESLDEFIEECDRYGIDSMIDMMNIDFPISVLRELKKQPNIVILHRGVDEERFNKEKMLPLHEIRRVKGAYDMMIAVAGGDTIREVQSAVFNDADIVVVWKGFYQNNRNTANIAEEFLQKIKY